MSATSGIRTGDRRAACALVVLAMLGAASCLPPLSHGVLTGTVVLGAPVTGARVRVWRLDLAGQRRHRAPVAEAVTDDAGRFRIDLGMVSGNLLVEAAGGQTEETWAGERLSLGEDDRLQAVLPLHTAVPARDIVISPVTTVAAALAAQRLASGQEALYHEAVRSAHALLGDHLGGIELPDTPAASITEPAAQLTPAVTHGLILAALSHLAGRMSEAAPATVRSVNTMTLTRALVADAEDGRLDGEGPDGSIALGLCLPPLGCPDCRPICRLSADTLRRDLATTLAFEVLGAPADRTGLGPDDVAALAAALTESTEPALFGEVAPGVLDDEAPVLAVLPSALADERADVIAFDEYAVPAHAPGGPMVVLGGEGACPDVYKHVHRMDDSSDNPLRWRVAVTDNGVGVAPGAVEYRVRFAPESVDLTGWLPAAPAGDMAGADMHEIVLLRAALPALAAREGVFEIDLRATDRLGNASALVRRCWTHHPLAVPLQVTPASVATGPDSLDSVSLDPGNNLAPLLNGVPLSQGKAVMSFELRNGTDEVAYVTLQHNQPSATYSKSWIVTNAALYEIDTPDDTCIPNDTCPERLEPDHPTEIHNGVRGDIPDLIGGIRVWDITSSASIEIFPCATCEPGQYRIDGRLGPLQSRRYRVAAVVTDLSALAPRRPDEPIEVYEESVLHPLFAPVRITGDVMGELRICLQAMETVCVKQEVYQRYRALQEIVINTSEIEMLGATSPTPNIPARVPAARDGTLGMPPRIDGLVWSTAESDLPAPNP